MRRRRAFTLIELLMVIAIIALLTGILIPAPARMEEGFQGVLSAPRTLAGRSG